MESEFNQSFDSLEGGSVINMSACHPFETNTIPNPQSGSLATFNSLIGPLTTPNTLDIPLSTHNIPLTTPNSLTTPLTTPKSFTEPLTTHDPPAESHATSDNNNESHPTFDTHSGPHKTVPTTLASIDTPTATTCTFVKPTQRTQSSPETPTIRTPPDLPTCVQPAPLVKETTPLEAGYNPATKAEAAEVRFEGKFSRPKAPLLSSNEYWPRHRSRGDSGESAVAMDTSETDFSMETSETDVGTETTSFGRDSSDCDGEVAATRRDVQSGGEEVGGAIDFTRRKQFTAHLNARNLLAEAGDNRMLRRKQFKVKAMPQSQVDLADVKVLWFFLVSFASPSSLLDPQPLSSSKKTDMK